MKTKNFNFLAILAILIVNCDKAKDDELDLRIDGRWILKEAQVQVYYGDTDLSGNKVTFDVGNRTVTFENQGDMQFIRESGTYEYSYRNGLLSFGSGRFYGHQLNNGKLILTFIDDPEVIDDEAAFVYEKE